MSDQGQFFETGSALLPHQTPAQHLARSTDPDTSHAAARHAEYRSGSAKARLLQAYREAWPLAMTDHAASIAAGFDPLRGAWKRCSDLRNDGRIERVGTAVGANGETVMTCRWVP